MEGRRRGSCLLLTCVLSFPQCTITWPPSLLPFDLMLSTHHELFVVPPPLLSVSPPCDANMSSSLLHACREVITAAAIPLNPPNWVERRRERRGGGGCHGNCESVAADIISCCTTQSRRMNIWASWTWTDEWHKLLSGPPTLTTERSQKGERREDGEGMGWMEDRRGHKGRLTDLHFI